MEHTGFWSIVPIVVAIACAVVTRQVILALFLGVYVGVLTVRGGSLQPSGRSRYLPLY